MTEQNLFEYAPAPESRSIVDIRSSYGLFVNGEFVHATDGQVVQDDQPVDRGGARRGRRGLRGRRRPGRQGRPARLHPCLVADVGPRALEVPLPDRPPAAGAQPRVRGAGDDRQRQADQGVPRRRRPHRGGALLLLRRLGRQARARRLRRRPAAARGRRPGDPLELPAADAGLEDRPGAGRRQHGGAQAGRDDPADRAAVRGDLPAGRPAPRRGQHPHRRRRHRPRDRGARRTSTRSRSPAPPRSAG